MTYSLELLLAALRRHGVWILIATLAFGIIAIATRYSAPPQYTAESQVLTLSSAVQISTPQDLALAQALSRNYAALALSGGVLREAAQRAGVQRSDAELRAGTRVTASRDSIYLTLSYTDRDPTVAANVSNALAAAFIERTQTSQTTVAKPVVDGLRADAASLTDQLKDVDERIAATQRLDSDARIDDATTRLVDTSVRQATLATLLSLRLTISSRLDERNRELRSVLANIGATILWQSALVPESPDPRRVAEVALASAAIGLVLATILAVGLEARDRRSSTRSTGRLAADRVARS